MNSIKESGYIEGYGGLFEDFYDVISELGVGSFGKVLKVMDRQSGKVIALKVISLTTD
jgi:serine/threonine protein kinase